MNEVPKPNIKVDFTNPFAGLNVPDMHIPNVAPVIGGATNFWCEGGVVPVASKVIDPPALQLVFQLARDLLNTLADLGYLDKSLKGMTQQLGNAWPAGQGGGNAMDKFVDMHGCFGVLGEQAGKLQQATTTLGGTLQDSMMSLLTTLCGSNATCAALGSNPWTAWAAKATAWCTVMKIVQWLLTVKTVIVAIAETVKAIKQATQDVDTTAAGLGATTLPAGSTVPGLPPSGYAYQQSPVPTVYDNPAYAGGAPGNPMSTVAPGYGVPGYGSGYGPAGDFGAGYSPGYGPGAGAAAGGFASGWAPETADGIDADEADRIEITVAKDGAVTVEAPEDRRLEIDVNVNGKHYDFDIKPA